jgi:NADH dehydrogenase
VGKTYELGGPEVLTFRELMERMLSVIRRRRLLVALPWWVGDIEATFLGLLPNPPLTRDMMRQLRTDNVVAPGVGTLADLGIAPTGLDAILPTYLARYRRGGRFGRRAMMQ